MLSLGDCGADGKVDERTVASSFSRLQLELDQPPWPFGGVRPQEL
jgi:hypothetical protein